MSDLRGRIFSDLVAGLNAGQHLAVDALVAFVDGELSVAARKRAAEHLATCRTCAAEVAAQRQASSVVRSAAGPQVPAQLLAALQAIPDTTELPAVPDGLAVTAQGTVVAVTGPARTTPQGSAAPLGSDPRWGSGPSMLGRRIGRTGAGVVVSGLVLGALIMTMIEEPVTGSAGQQPQRPRPASLVLESPGLPVVSVTATAAEPTTNVAKPPGDHDCAAPSSSPARRGRGPLA